MRTFIMILTLMLMSNHANALVIGGSTAFINRLELDTTIYKIDIPYTALSGNNICIRTNIEHTECMESINVHSYIENICGKFIASSWITSEFKILRLYCYPDRPINIIQQSSNIPQHWDAPLNDISFVTNVIVYSGILLFIALIISCI